MTKKVKTMCSGRSVLRFTVLSAGLVLVSSFGIQLAQAQSELPCIDTVFGEVLCGVDSTALARGPLLDRIDIHMQAHVGRKVETVHVKAAADVVVAEITIQKEGFIGWHSHPGPAIVVVKTGTLTIYDAEPAGTTCTEGRSYGPGQSFVDLGQGHIHNAKNHSTENVLVYVTYLDVPPGQSPLQPEEQGAFCTLPTP